MKGFTSIDFLCMMAALNIRSDVPVERRLASPYEARDRLVAAGVPVKVIYACAETCASRGYWDYGVNVMGGWVTPKGMERLRSMRPPEESRCPSR